MCSINLFGAELGDDKFLPYVIDQFIAAVGCDHKLIRDHRERRPSQASQANRFIQALKELGCKSRSTIRYRPVLGRISETLSRGDFLKIDGSVRQGNMHDPIDREMVRSINEIGHLNGKTHRGVGRDLEISTCCAAAASTTRRAWCLRNRSVCQGREFARRRRGPVNFCHAKRMDRSTARTCGVMLAHET